MIWDARALLRKSVRREECADLFRREDPGVCPRAVSGEDTALQRWLVSELHALLFATLHLELGTLEVCYCCHSYISVCQSECMRVCGCGTDGRPVVVALERADVSAQLLRLHKCGRSVCRMRVCAVAVLTVVLR